MPASAWACTWPSRFSGWRWWTTRTPSGWPRHARRRDATSSSSPRRRSGSSAPPARPRIRSQSSDAGRRARALGAFQDIAQGAAARPVTKAAWTAEDPARLGQDVARALALAQSGRPGPVHLSLPGDVLDANVPEARPAPVAVVPPALARASDVTAALAALTEAKRPAIVAGPGMARGRRWAAVQKLARLLAVPALPSESPRGLNDPWLRGANARLAEADVVLLLGKALDFSLRFGRAPAWPGGCRFVQVTAEPAPERDGVVSIIADPPTVVDQLTAAAPSPAATGWAGEVARTRAATPPAWNEWRRSAATPMHPLAGCAAVPPRLDRGALLVADRGGVRPGGQAGPPARARLIH